MRVVLLGTAAGGGLPQWNCACPLCAAARAGDPAVPPRTQDCLAVSVTGRDWYLINASPDLRAQLLATPALAAGPGMRDTPVRGVLCTDAELDHTLGLAVLRGQPGLRIWAPRAVGVRGLVAGYADWEWSAVVPGEPFRVAAGLLVSAVAVSDKRPRYAATADPGGTWVVAYRLADPATGGAVLYAPCVRDWPAAFDDLLDTVDCVLLDGTFWSADELDGQRAMGHLPISGPAGSLAIRSRYPGVRWIYTHLNNTNPVARTGSPERRMLDGADAEVLADGTELDF